MSNERIFKCIDYDCKQKDGFCFASHLARHLASKRNECIMTGIWICPKHNLFAVLGKMEVLEHLNSCQLKANYGNRYFSTKVTMFLI